jgi:AcrR family transcriptional regulator
MHHAINNLDRMTKRSRSAPSAGKASAPAERTRTRILEAAERLFSERGIETVSVRSILAATGVNPALAHYHFGSREGLIAELLRMRVAPLVEELVRAIDAVDARGTDATVEDVLRAYFTPAARWMVDAPRIGRLLSQLQSSPSEDVRAMGRDALRKAITRLGEAVMKRLPRDLDPKRVFFRFYLLIGGPSFLGGNWEHIRRSARRYLGADAAMEASWIAEELVRCGVALLLA